MQEPANQQVAGMFSPVLNIGDAFMESVLDRLSKEDLKAVLDLLQDERAAGLFGVIRIHCQQVYLSTSALEGIDPKTLDHVRTQMFALMSVQEALIKHGMQAREGHPRLTPQTEEPQQ